MLIWTMTWSNPFNKTEENRVSQYVSLSIFLFKTSQAFSLYKFLIVSRYSVEYFELWRISKSVFPNFGWVNSVSLGIVISVSFW